MVNLSLPNGCSDSVTEGTPNLTINHDVAADLDSTNAFEGPEKLLEVWFAPDVNALPPSVSSNGLKEVPAETWVSMLDMVNCKILSVVRSDDVDAYLLSESSMFVFPHKLILKTCGTTTLLLGLKRMLEIAAVDAGFPCREASGAEDGQVAASTHRVFYSRKNFLFPDQQRGPHRSWDLEVEYLDDMLRMDGSAYTVGKTNGDHWYLYLTSPIRALTPPLTPEVEDINGQPTPESMSTGSGTQSPSAHHNDETLEILMTDLDVENAKQFFLPNAIAVAKDNLAREAQAGRPQASINIGGLTTPEETEVCEDGDENMLGAKALAELEQLTTEGHALGTVVAENCGLTEVYPKSSYPDARVDAYIFSPCGFSANGVIPAPAPADGSKPAATHYFTVHVTPEPGFSFASFETNVPSGQNGKTTAEIIQHVVRIFKPGKFSVSQFEAKGRDASPFGLGDDRLRHLSTENLLEAVSGYKRVDRIVHDFEDYDLVFRYYTRNDLVGKKSRKGARLGAAMVPAHVG